MGKWVKNNDVTSHTWAGQVVNAGEYHQIEQSREAAFAESDKLLTDIGNGIAIMARDDSGTKDIDGVGLAISYLKNDLIDEKDYDNRSIVHSTPRYRGTVTCFSSRDDDNTDETKIWGGPNKLAYDHKIGDPVSHTMYLDFNTIANRTYLLTGLLKWCGAKFDEWHCCIVPSVTTTSVGVNTNYNLFGGYLVVPAAGDGTVAIQPADMKLVQITRNEFGEPAGAGYWDATYNTGTKAFENITANPLGTGEFNMFAVEVPFHKYVENFIMIGDGSAKLTAFDADQLGHNIRLRFDFMTVGTDHDWQFAGNVTMFREKTI